MRECALSADLAPGARLRARGGVAARQAGGTRHSATPHHHPHLPATTRPRQLIGSPSNSSRMLSISSTMDPQRIRAQRPLDPPQSHQIHYRSIQVSQGARGHFGLKKSTPPAGISAAKSPLPRRTTLDVTRRIARPRREHIEIGRQRPIGLSERPQNR